MYLTCKYIMLSVVKLISLRYTIRDQIKRCKRDANMSSVIQLRSACLNSATFYDCFIVKPTIKAIKLEI